MSEPETGHPMWLHVNKRCPKSCQYCDIAELKAELEDTVTECLAAKSNEDILRKQLAELKANSADAMNALMNEVHESKKNAAFFRCCALSGEVPKDGAEPHPKKEYAPPSKELLAALLQEQSDE